jgi:diacylglycerol kinase
MSDSNRLVKAPQGLVVRWLQKFRCAFRGIGWAVSTQDSFAVHIPFAILVMLAAWWMQCGLVEWSILLLCIGIVLVAELFNTAIECLARAITREQHPEIGRALDIASGAVLAASITAVFVGLITLLPLLSRYLRQFLD